MRKRDKVGRLLRRVLSKATKAGSASGSTLGEAWSERADGDTFDTGHADRIEYGEAADILATDGQAVLVGSVGLKLGLEPRGKTLIVNHWATWCDACLAEMPELSQLRTQTLSSADFVGVGWEGFSGGGTPTDWVARVGEVSKMHGLSWPTMVFEGSPEELFSSLEFEVHTVPQTWVIGVDGDILYRVHGALTVENVDVISTLTGVSG